MNKGNALVQLIEHFRKYYIEQLYAPVLKASDIEITGLIQQNCALTHETHSSFAYKGQYYNKDWRPAPPHRPKLHDKLVPAVESWLREFGRDIEMEQRLIDGYLRSITAFDKQPKNWLPLLPPDTHQYVRVLFATDDWETDLSSEKIEAFLAKYQTGYDLIRKRLALNLLL